MDKPQLDKNPTIRTEVNVPQLRVQTGLSAGESVEACLNNLEYWRNDYYDKCGWAYPTTYGY